MRVSASGFLSRRAFLEKAACALAVAPMAGVRAGAEGDLSGPWTMRLSASSIAYSRLPIEEACQRIASLGFEAIDIWSAHAGCPHLDDALDRLGAGGLKELLAKTRLDLLGFSVYKGGFAKYAKLLGDAGGGLAIRGSAKDNGTGPLSARMGAFLEGLKPELELCERHDCRLAIENHGGSLLNTLDSVKAFADLNRHPRLGIALAPFHVQSAGESVEEAIRLAGPQLFFFYAWQRGQGLAQLPGHGPTDFTPWLAALAAVGYAGWVNPFMHHEPEPDAMSEALAKARDSLRSCRAAAVSA